MTFSLVLDVLVAVLLVVTISYALVLNRRLTGLRRDKKELEKLAASFGQATARASESIGTLRSTAGDLQARIDKAQGLRDDLQFLVERASSAADRLEQAVRASRKETPQPMVAAGAAATASVAARAAAKKPFVIATDVEDDAKSKAERDLLRALRAVR